MLISSSTAKKAKPVFPNAMRSGRGIIRPEECKSFFVDIAAVFH